MRPLHHLNKLVSVLKLSTNSRQFLVMAKILKIKGDEVSKTQKFGFKEFIIKLAFFQLSTDHALEEATSVLNAGGVVALPTDTLYGIAASVNSTAAIERLYEIKGRLSSKPIAICVSDIEDIDK